MPTHFGSYLSPIRELQEEHEIFDMSSSHDAIAPLTFLPEVDSVALLTPTSRETLKHPAGPFQATPSAEDLSIFSGVAPSEVNFTSRNRSWSGKLKDLLWSLGSSALATLSSADDHSSNSTNDNNSTFAALDQWPSSNTLASLDNTPDEDWENIEEMHETSLAVGFPFSSNSFTFGSAEPPEPLLWD
jgi:hypothetical protein